jgi:hypothetical protein
MTRFILMDQIHIDIRVPRGLSDREYESVRRTLDSYRFQTTLRGSVRITFRRFPSLKHIRVRVVR